MLSVFGESVSPSSSVAVAAVGFVGEIDLNSNFHLTLPAYREDWMKRVRGSPMTSSRMAELDLRAKSTE